MSFKIHKNVLIHANVILYSDFFISKMGMVTDKFSTLFHINILSIIAIRIMFNFIK